MVVAAEIDGRWIDFTRAYRIYELMESRRLGMPVRNVLELLRAGLVGPAALDPILDAFRRHAVIEKCALTGPLSFDLPFRPGKVVAIGRNYAAHAAETGHDVPKEPIFFAKSPTACIGPDQPIVTRPEYGRVDHEGELAVVIGRVTKGVAPAEVRECIAGYALLNDVTAREMQKKDIDAGHPWFRSKSLDTFCPFGPYMVLRDALPWPLEVDIECAVNGEIRQKSNTRHFIFKLPELIAYVS
ncbi:MAG: fumarylacetoacetate hydrolase family protein, partial [Candidatus Hydrogenedentes bacterium]|nr:fumarylacetoacetate hydrolase family protein [Candidatus Hydrogenedentota bacterium]